MNWCERGMLRHENNFNFLYEIKSNLSMRSRLQMWNELSVWEKLILWNLLNGIEEMYSKLLSFLGNTLCDFLCILCWRDDMGSLRDACRPSQDGDSHETISCLSDESIIFFQPRSNKWPYAWAL